jgi:hypothetical protein
MADTETLTSDDVVQPTIKTKQDSHESDFPSMGVDLIKRINIKVAFFIFIIGLFVFSDVFIEKFLPIDYHDGTNEPNTSGTIVQLVVLVLCYIVIDLLSQGGVL